MLVQKLEYITIRYLVSNPEIPFTNNDHVIIIFNILLIGLIFIIIAYTTKYILHKIDADIQKGYDLSTATRHQEYRRKKKLARERDIEDQNNKSGDSDENLQQQHLQQPVLIPNDTDGHSMNRNSINGSIGVDTPVLGSPSGTIELTAGIVHYIVFDGNL